MSLTALELDGVIFGGGAAGLFTLAALRAAGFSVLLLERDALGAGQTRCAQGIIHGGIKYSLGGLLGSGSRQIAGMPERWLRMADGAEAPSLARAELRSRACWLWRSEGIAGHLGMLGAKLALRAKPEEVAIEERPDILRAVRGAVLRLPEPVFDPCSVLEALAESQHGCIARYRMESLEVIEHAERIGLRAEVEVEAPGTTARDAGRRDRPSERAAPPPASTRRDTVPISIRARCVILAAGVGNEALRERFERPAGRTQRRPLHQVLVRSPRLPIFDGHCIDGDATRVTVTSAVDDARGVVWHLGGRLAEDGVALDGAAQVRRAADELRAVLPGAPLDDAEFAAYRVDRAEPLEGGRRPDDARLIEEGSVLSLWPVKLALAPRAAELVVEAMQRLVGERQAAKRGPGSSSARGGGHPGAAATDEALAALRLAAPAAAPPPWHDALEWTPVP